MTSNKPVLMEHARKVINLDDYFEPSEVATSSKNLFRHFRESSEWTALPKVIFSNLMHEKYGTPDFQDEKKDLGYMLKLKNKKEFTIWRGTKSLGSGFGFTFRQVCMCLLGDKLDKDGFGVWQTAINSMPLTPEPVEPRL